MRNRQSTSDLFKGRHFEQEIIVLRVRWYLRYKLSYRDLVEMMAERGLSVAHSTILRWVRRYTLEFDKRWGRFSTQAGTSWRVDETYVRIRGQWAYLYRRSTRQATPSISDSARGATSPRQKRSSARPQVLRAARRCPSHSTVMLPPFGPFVNFNSKASLRS